MENTQKPAELKGPRRVQTSIRVTGDGAEGTLSVLRAVEDGILSAGEEREPTAICKIRGHSLQITIMFIIDLIYRFFSHGDTYKLGQGILA